MDSYTKVSRKLPFSLAGLPKKVVVSYISDYLIIIVLVGIFFALDSIEPFHQPFALQNYTLQYPYASHERVPIGLALALVVLLPGLVIAFYTLVLDGLFSHHKTPGTGKRGPYTLRSRLWELNCGILGLLLASGTAFVITNALKNATGKPRPDFIDRCQPKPDAADPVPYGLSTDEVCTRRDLLKDGYRSFPSGHSSSSFAGLFYLSLYLAGKLHIWDSRAFVWKTFLVIVPTLGAALIAISRIEDARHHPFDVITGSLLGVACAWVSYRQYFPPLSEPWSKGRAYPIRTWGSPEEPRYVGDGGFRSGAGERPRGASVAAPLRAEGMESLRSGGLEPGRGISRMNTVPLDGTEETRRRAGENVFRQQVAAGEQARSGDGEYYASPRGHRDEWEESETESEDDLERVAREGETYELQPRGASALRIESGA